jgi:hypothetical protein
MNLFSFKYVRIKKRVKLKKKNLFVSVMSLRETNKLSNEWKRMFMFKSVDASVAKYRNSFQFVFCGFLLQHTVLQNTQMPCFEALIYLMSKKPNPLHYQQPYALGTISQPST